MKRLVILIIVVVLAAGIGAASYVYAAGTEGKAVEKEEGDAAAAHPDFEYIQMDPLQVPVITAKGVTHQVSLVVSLEVGYGEKEAISFYTPKLADAYLQDLYGALGTGAGLTRGDIVDVPLIKQRLTTVTDKVLGPEHKVRGVLLQVVQQKKM